MTPPELTLHASTVAVEGRGVLILGPSGAGKSALALQLMALGAGLVADDQTCLQRDDDQLIATCPCPLRGLIEARGVGILHAPPFDRATIALVIDLGQTEPDRLPPPRSVVLLQCRVNLVLGPVTPHFPAAILYYLTKGRAA